MSERTNKQKLGDFGESVVISNCDCPLCGDTKPFKALPKNYPTLDIQCKSCGEMGQVKAKRKNLIDICPSSVLGAAWEPQKKLLDSGKFHMLFVVTVNGDDFRIFYLSPSSHTRSIFIPRKPLSENARRAGWRGFTYNLSEATNPPILIF